MLEFLKAPVLILDFSYYTLMTILNLNLIYETLDWGRKWLIHFNAGKKLYCPFLWMGFNCSKATELLRGSSLLFTTKFPEIPGTHFINLGRMKG